MSGFLDKMSEFFFKSDEDNDTQAEQTVSLEDPLSRGEQSRPRYPEKKTVKKSNLIAVPSKKTGEENMEIVLFRAASYDDMQEIARHIKERKVAIVNFEDMDKAVAQRMVDFLSGAAFALDGVPRKVSGGTFVFSSAQVDMSGKIMETNSDFEAEDFTSDPRFSSNQWLRP